LHPSRSLYEFVEGRSPAKDGHRLYEAVPVLAALLRGWPEVSIVLTSAQPRAKGLPAVLKQLGPELAPRVLGFTYEDLTTKLRRGPRQEPLSNDDYWRLSKAEIVRLHVGWLRPEAWIAVDDEDMQWTEHERLQHLVAVDGCKGLLDPAAQDRLVTMLVENFGPARQGDAACIGCWRK
jgi:hypothetical protein